MDGDGPDEIEGPGGSYRASRGGPPTGPEPRSPYRVPRVGDPSGPSGQSDQYAPPPDRLNGLRPGWQLPPAPAPDDGSVVPLRPYGLGAIYRGVGRVARRAPGVVVAAALLGFAVDAAFRLSAGPSERIVRNGDSFSSFTDKQQVHVQIRTGALVLGALGVLGGVLVAAVLVPLALALVAGRRPTRPEYGRTGPRAGLAYVFTALLSVPGELLTGLGRGNPGATLVGLLLALVVLYVRPRLLLMPAVAAAEGVGVGTAARRSWWLVGGSWWRTFGLSFAFDAVGLVGAVVVAIVSTTTLLGAADNSSTLFPGRPLLLVIALFSMVSFPVQVTSQALLYVDLRCRREGLAWRLDAARRNPALPAFGPGGTYDPTGAP